MPETKVDYNADTGICVVSASGPLSRPDDSQAILSVAAEVAAKHDCSRYIFDMREAEINSTTMGAYEIAINPERFGFSRHFRIAAVYKEVGTHEKFMEDVGHNRGATAFRVFSDYDKAHEWMLKD